MRRKLRLGITAKYGRIHFLSNIISIGKGQIQAIKSTFFCKTLKHVQKKQKRIARKQRRPVNHQDRFITYFLIARILKIGQHVIKETFSISLFQFLLENNLLVSSIPQFRPILISPTEMIMKIYLFMRKPVLQWFLQNFLS